MSGQRRPGNRNPVEIVSRMVKRDRVAIGWKAKVVLPDPEPCEVCGAPAVRSLTMCADHALAASPGRDFRGIRRNPWSGKKKGSE